MPKLTEKRAVAIRLIKELAKELKKRSFTQKEIAKLLGKTQAWVSKALQS